MLFFFILSSYTLDKRMASFNTTMVLLILILEIATPLFLLSCYANDSNGRRGSVCSPTAAADPTSIANLDNLYISLSTNVNPNGYYKTEVGQNSDRIYGLVQCRGDISPSNCSNCTRESIRMASKDCNGSKNVIIWQKWCFLRYSNESFYGDWERTRVSMSDPSFDDPNVAAKGTAMMRELVASTPKETVMFATSEVDVGNDGKRYGMAQCTRDLGKTECGDCLDYMLNSLGTMYDNRTNWEIYAVGCSLWYDDSQFYFNYKTAPSVNDANRGWTGRFGIGLTILMIGMACI